MPWLRVFLDDLERVTGLKLAVEREGILYRVVRADEGIPLSPWMTEEELRRALVFATNVVWHACRRGEDEGA